MALAPAFKQISILGWIRPDVPNEGTVLVMKSVVRGSNPVIMEILSRTFRCLLLGAVDKTKIKKKRFLKQTKEQTCFRIKNHQLGT